MNITEILIERVAELQRDSIPGHVLLGARECLVDYVGVCIAGAKILEEYNQKFLKETETAGGKTTVIGMNLKRDAYTAVLVNGWNAHAAELDDGHRFGMIHLGAVIFPALIAIAEEKEIESHMFFKGAAAGYEAAVTLASAMQPSHKKRGYHTTGTCGTVGAAVAAAVASGYSREQMKSSICAAATSAGGILEIQEDGSELKPYNAGHAALAGYVAAKTAVCRGKGPRDILGGPRGMLRVMSGWDGGELHLPQNYYIETIYRKPYASCRHSHAAIEAALTLRKEYGLRAGDIREILVETYEAAVLGHDHTVIHSCASARMSIPYCIAAVIEYGSAGISEFSEKCIWSENISKLLTCIKVKINLELTDLAPQKRAAIVKIKTLDGNQYEQRSDYAKGDHENPMSRMELEEKFISLCSFSGIRKDHAHKILDDIWKYE